MVYRARRSCSPKSFLNKFLLPLILDTQFSVYDYNRNLNQTVMVTSCVIIKIKGFFFCYLNNQTLLHAYNYELHLQLQL